MLVISRKLDNLSEKDSINVVFFVLFCSTWKLDSLYLLMQSHKRFKPTILICPVVDNGYDYMIEQMEKSYNFFKKLGYDVYKAYDKQKNTYINPRKAFSPDIIFYTNPYDGLVDDRYYITNFQDILSCYVSYAYNNIAASYTYNMPFHDRLWRFYLENDSMVEFFNSRLGYVRENHVAVGYPSFDSFNRRNIEEKKEGYKYIIWAPHHTLEPEFGVLHRDSFLYYSEVMMEMVKKYHEEVVFIFRPHPLLKSKLYSHPAWGKKKTDDYYNYWNKRENTLLSETRDYIDDFILSDAIIHDSGSFTIEYLYTLKPALFIGERPNDEHLTPSAVAAFDCYYFAKSKVDIENFINFLIEDKEDIMLSRKVAFKNEYLQVNEKQVAQNIIDDILSNIDNV